MTGVFPDGFRRSRGCAGKGWAISNELRLPQANVAQISHVQVHVRERVKVVAECQIEMALPNLVPNDDQATA